MIRLEMKKYSMMLTVKHQKYQPEPAGKIDKYGYLTG